MSHQQRKQREKTMSKPTFSEYHCEAQDYLDDRHYSASGFKKINKSVTYHRGSVSETVTVRPVFSKFSGVMVGFSADVTDSTGRELHISMINTFTVLSAQLHAHRAFTKKYYGKA
jgi:hypothetical protein